ncbi:MAG: DUF120 domain-containing protein [Haloarculaceae archaeon]
MAETGAAVGADELATLKHLALAGALDGQTKLSTAALADRLDASKQTASRRLQRLEDEAFVERELQSDGQLVAVTQAGERALRREYEQYRRVFEEDVDVTLTGRVTSGMGEGRHYISLPGYMRQFQDLLGYEPFAGTLNVDLDEESVRERARLEAFEPIFVAGWEDDERTYGPVFCWPASLGPDGEYAPAHIIAPERTHHGKDQLELVAPDRLRDELGLDDGDEITIHVTDY